MSGQLSEGHKNLGLLIKKRSCRQTRNCKSTGEREEYQKGVSSNTSPAWTLPGKILERGCLIVMGWGTMFSNSLWRITEAIDPKNK